jgi:ADP-ribose pyrophosphatase YjhB (NUDIX family)
MKAKDRSGDREQKDGPRQQYAALPWRVGDDGEIEILIATSRRARRWIIPKGWPIKGRKPHATAAAEARQETGLIGDIERSALGFYHYAKRRGNGAVVACRVEVFALKVTRRRRRWPEKGQRDTQWAPYRRAAELVEEIELREIILRFGETPPPDTSL